MSLFIKNVQQISSLLQVMYLRKRAALSATILETNPWKHNCSEPTSTNCFIAYSWTVKGAPPPVQTHTHKFTHIFQGGKDIHHERRWWKWARHSRLNTFPWSCERVTWKLGIQHCAVMVYRTIIAEVSYQINWLWQLLPKSTVSLNLKEPQRKSWVVNKTSSF